MKRILSLLAIVLLLWSCKTTKDVIYDGGYEESLLDTLTVSAPVYVEGEAYDVPVYQAAAERKYDITHTKLELSFDWEKEHVLGKATIFMTPIFYDLEEVVLDAKNFDIHRIINPKNNRNIKYKYDGKKLTLLLDRTFQRGQQLAIVIDYTAKPSEGPISGSKAITSDKGLFFINARGEDTEKPRQLWTQGETENNSRWFPTFDKPNERFTQEIYLTVEDAQETLSNGTLVSSTENNDGTRTDYWKLDEPHAPYLAMVAVGDFARVTDTWNGRPLEYLVDPPYEGDAKAIFDHTPEMLSFFSEILDYPYPWSKYSQIIVEDFVSGAMENTTAVTFGDFVQKSSRELIDNGNDKIVAHEMFHHWFGDLVTCESWSNLTLNEGFANYSEYLWYEHKYGRDAADHHRAEELNTYLFMADREGTHNLIHYGYDDKEDMFDVHSYNKGGLVLHMLRKYVGDEAFFASLHRYLEDNKYTAVEVDELRMAFEDVTGMDLNWFFDQWFLDQGHPVIEVSDSYDATQKTVTIITRQIQDTEYHRAVFRLPLEVAVIDTSGNISYHKQTLESRIDTLIIEDISSKPLAVLLDGKAYALAELLDEKSDAERAAILQYGEYWEHKMKATIALAHSPLPEELASKLMEEKHYSLRIKGLEAGTVTDHYRMARDMSIMDPHSEVRAAALQKYAEKYPKPATIIAKTMLSRNTGGYAPIKAALNILYDQDKESALHYAEKLAQDPSLTLVTVLASLLAETGDAKYLDYIEKNLDKVSVYQVYNVFDAYSSLLLKQDVSTMYDAAVRLSPLAKTGGNMYKRLMATKTISQVKDKLTQTMPQSDTIKSKTRALREIIAKIKATETNAELLERYKAY